MREGASHQHGCGRVRPRSVLFLSCFSTAGKNDLLSQRVKTNVEQIDPPRAEHCFLTSEKGSLFAKRMRLSPARLRSRCKRNTSAAQRNSGGPRGYPTGNASKPARAPSVRRHGRRDRAARRGEGVTPGPPLHRQRLGHPGTWRNGAMAQAIVPAWLATLCTSVQASTSSPPQAAGAKDAAKRLRIAQRPPKRGGPTGGDIYLLESPARARLCCSHPVRIMIRTPCESWGVHQHASEDRRLRDASADAHPASSVRSPADGATA